MMKFTHKLWVLGLLLALSVSGVLPASAQLRSSSDVEDQVERVRQEFERTEELLARVAPMVREANVPRARELFGRAVTLQTQAKGIMARAVQQFDAGHPRVAAGLVREGLGLTLKSRDLAQRAGAVLREQVGIEERAQRAIERANAIIARAEENDLASDSRLTSLLEEAKRQVDTAERHYADHNFEVALRIAESSLKLLRGVAEDANDTPSSDRLRRELHRTQEMFDRIRERSGDLDEDRTRLLERAGGLLEDAREALAAGQRRRAMRQIEQARRLLKRIQSQGTAGVAESDFRGALARFDGAYERAQNAADEDAPESVQKLLSRAASGRESAVDAAAAGQTKRAMERLRAAFELVSRARRLLGDSP
jgi:hypothetical protein